MMGKRATALAAALAVLLPAGAWAADVQLQIGTGLEWDSNVGRGRGADEDDFIFQVRPKFRFLEEQGKAQWNLYYEPSYEKAFDTDRIDDVRHFFNGKASYKLSEATEFWVRDSLRYSEEINTVTSLDNVGNVFVSTGDAEVLRNDLMAGVNHMFTPRLSALLNFSYMEFQTDLFNRSDNRTLGGSSELRYMVTPLHSAGLGAGVSHQDFDASPSGAVSASEALFVAIFGSWNWQIDPTTKLEVRAGPTYVDNEQDPPAQLAPVNPFPLVTDPASGLILYTDATNCADIDPSPVVQQFVLENFDFGPACGGGTGLQLIDGTGLPGGPDYNAIQGIAPISATFPGGVPPGLSAKDWTIFAEVSLTKQWRPNLRSRLAYERREDTASGLGGSAVRDEVSFFTAWQISPRWDTAVSGGWARRESTTDFQETLFTVTNEPVPGGSGTLIARIVPDGLVQRPNGFNIDTDRWSAAWRLTRRITKNLSVSTRYTYANQTSESRTPGARDDFEAHLVTLNVQYDFDRWTLW